jgi:RNA polymerase sigma-70 factor, ECF subfamily
MRDWGEWEFADPSPNAEQIFARRQALDLLSHAVNRLTSCQRSILEQRYGEEKSVREAAATLGITLAAAKSRLLRARLTLRSVLEGKRKSMTDACY